MQYSMVMIICFAAGVCQTVFDEQKFSSYNSCINSANEVVSYMKDLYPTSSGEVKCLDEMEIIELMEKVGKQ